jgi:polysaccharide export outer membrane protein
MTVFKRVLSRARPNRAVATVLGVCIVQLVAAACSNIGALPPPEAVPGERKPYVIGVTDVLTISVWKNPELGIQVPVRSDGMISVPLLDDIQAEGLTPHELKEVITESLSEFIAAPDVTVVVSQMNSNVISMMGDGLPRSTVLPLRKEMRVLEAIAMVGGFTPYAKKNKIRILRKTPLGLVEYRFNYGAYLAGKAPESNIFLMTGDTVIVED